MSTNDDLTYVGNKYTYVGKNNNEAITDEISAKLKRYEILIKTVLGCECCRTKIRSNNADCPNCLEKVRNQNNSS
jgi:hypothetical protein